MLVHVSENEYMRCCCCCCCCWFFLTTIKSDLCSEISRCCSLFGFCCTISKINTLNNLLTLSQFCRSPTLSLSLVSNGHFSSLIRVSQFWDYNKWLNEMKNIIISTVAKSIQMSQLSTRWIAILVSIFPPSKITQYVLYCIVLCRGVRRVCEFELDEKKKHESRKLDKNNFIVSLSDICLQIFLCLIARKHFNRM